MSENKHTVNLIYIFFFNSEIALNSVEKTKKGSRQHGNFTFYIKI